MSNIIICGLLCLLAAFWTWYVTYSHCEEKIALLEAELEEAQEGIERLGLQLERYGSTLAQEGEHDVYEV